MRGTGDQHLYQFDIVWVVDHLCETCTMIVKWYCVNQLCRCYLCALVTLVILFDLRIWHCLHFLLGSLRAQAGPLTEFWCWQRSGGQSGSSKVSWSRQSCTTEQTGWYQRKESCPPGCGLILYLTTTLASSLTWIMVFFPLEGSSQAGYVWNL